MVPTSTLGPQIEALRARGGWKMGKTLTVTKLEISGNGYLANLAIITALKIVELIISIGQN